ncbi:MAG: helix-turn-helix domain-containing protein [Acidimicrobiales bacterium]
MVHDELQQQARALGDPTRHRLSRYIAEAPDPVGVADLTAFVRLNHNAVRQHLAVLKDAGLVLEAVEDRRRRGGDAGARCQHVPRLVVHTRPVANRRGRRSSIY